MKRFNIRVYGILLNERQEVLVTDEHRFGLSFTKFPGGGLEQGEGTIECLQRECLEELGQEVEALEHFYTTDYYQPSAFDERDQLLSIYYTIRLKQPQQFKTSDNPFDFDVKEGAQSFRWVPLQELSDGVFRFPVDKKVAAMLRRG